MLWVAFLSTKPNASGIGSSVPQKATGQESIPPVAFFAPSLCLALRSAAPSGTEIVTRRYTPLFRPRKARPYKSRRVHQQFTGLLKCCFSLKLAFLRAFLLGKFRILTPNLCQICVKICVRIYLSLRHFGARSHR